ncbi:MAG: hypothetical protein IPM98_05400 [Lewinellaceae bacterium]|nr:hypothetical protein [Lewinellaceae bacterium]
MLIALAWFAIAGVGAQNGKPAVQVSPMDVSCTGQTDGRLDFTLVSGAVPVAFQWANLSGGTSGNGQLAQIGQNAALTNLPPGLYRLTFVASDGADTTVEHTIKNPPPLGGNLFLLTNFGGFPVACAYGGSGVALFDATGGTPPYAIQWSNGDQDIRADSLFAGPIAVSITDARGCSIVVDTVLQVPAPLDAKLVVEGETCLGQNSGSIRITMAGGGMPPYQFSLNGGPFSNKTDWMNLPPGPYFIQMQDAAGCLLPLAALLPSGLEFTLKLGADTTLFSGDTLRRAIVTNPAADTLIWRPAQGVQMLSATEALLFPAFTTTYHVTALNADGCSATDEVVVTVIRNRDLYVPNVFAPEAQIAENRMFTVFGSGGIRTVALLQVYDRFGRLWFENHNFPVNDAGSGWNGANNTDAAPVGVYLWRAVVLYTDGREMRLQGDVTLVR